MSNVNLKKQLVDELKTKSVKTTKSGKRGLAVDGRTIATLYDAANGSIRAFVVAKPKLPAKLAKHFKLTQTRGYAARFTVDDDLTPLVDAIVFVAQNDVEQPAAKSDEELIAEVAKSVAPKKSSTKRATTASKRASARKTASQS